MYIKNGIAYADDPTPPIKVNGIRPLDDFKLWIRFNTGEIKIFDLKPKLQTPAFTPLQDKNLFTAVYIDYGIPTWNDGTIDIAPEYLYKHSVPLGGNPNA